MALAGMSVLTLAAGALIFFGSFTGHLILSIRGDASHPSRDALLRFKALHAVGAPLLLSLCILGLWILTIRLARRASGARGPSSTSG